MVDISVTLILDKGALCIDKQHDHKMSNSGAEWGKGEFHNSSEWGKGGSIIVQL